MKIKRDVKQIWLIRYHEPQLFLLTALSKQHSNSITAQTTTDIKHKLYSQLQKQWKYNNRYWRSRHCSWCHPRLQCKSSWLEYTWKRINIIFSIQLS